MVREHEGLCLHQSSIAYLHSKIHFLHQWRCSPAVQDLRQKEKDSWLVGGSSLISQFINDGLLDEMTISIVPNLIGKGIPLFQEIREIRQLRLSSSKNYKDGVVQLSYRF